jgi:hypothetical protein
MDYCKSARSILKNLHRCIFRVIRAPCRLESHKQDDDTKFLSHLGLLNFPLVQNNLECLFSFGTSVSASFHRTTYVPNSFSICPLLALSKTPCAPCLFVTKISNESTTSTRGVDGSLRYLATASAETTITTKSLDFALYNILVCCHRLAVIKRE